ncbi:MAG TPA: OmpA family protein [Thermoanaerobaculia bacterium]|jgi:outer membrane protein OmpA-like peptidoglycan-associated protein
MKRLLLVAALVLCVCPILAQEEDAEGCRDSAVLSRMKSCRIESCDKKDFDRADIHAGASEQMQAVEGEVETIIYHCGDNVSFLSIVRNAENALKAAGFTKVYSGPGMNESPAYSARKGGVWIDVQTQPNGGQTYTQTVVRSKEMEQEMTASAESMEAEIARSGYCSIYGVLFDTGKATIQPASEKCLTEMAKLLKNNPSWKLQVEGHTDNVGGKDPNVKLSQSRAEAVQGWLVSHGIEGSRLSAKGFGDAKPVADNTTEDGRAKNRRVDLRKL